MTMKVVSASEGGLLPKLPFADVIFVNAEEEEDESDEKHPRWLPKRDQDKRSDDRSSGELQVPGINHLQRRIQT